MTNKLNKLLISYGLSIAVFAYLTFHHYMTKMGLSGDSFCKVSQTVNCDTAALSNYAEILSIPIAALGLSYAIIMFLQFLFLKWGWFEESDEYTSLVKIITSFSSLYSVVLLAISIFDLKVFCPFCIAGYILSFVISYLVLSTQTPWRFSMGSISNEKNFIGALLFVPFLAWFISGSIKNSYGLGELDKVVPEKIALWKVAKPQSFDENSGIMKGQLTAPKATLVEFADFKCPHCKAASQTLKTFINNTQNVKLVFKPFPLDGLCNNSVTQRGDGSRCQMAGLVLCAEKIFQKGWNVHDSLFENQEALQQVSDLNTFITEISSQFSMNREELKACSTSEATYAEIKSIAAEGSTAQISGTPTIFLNNKKLDYGQFIEVLKTAIDSL